LKISQKKLSEVNSLLYVDVSVIEERIIDGLQRNLLASERTSANLFENMYTGT